MLNMERVREWTQSLRTTDQQQAKGKLVKVNEHSGEVVGMCCLGIGEVECAGVEYEVRHEGALPHAAFYEVVLSKDDRRRVDPALPVFFMDWLGFAASPSDLYPDWPNDLHFRDGHNPRFMNVGCTNLNDQYGLSFSQIADVIDHFGVRS